MMFRTENNSCILEREPYHTFLKKYSKLTNIINEKINMKIESDEKRSDTGFYAGFSLDYCYANRIDLAFEFYELMNTECIQKSGFCLIHRIGCQFEKNECNHNIMLDMIEDIEKRNGYFYISSLVKDCEMKCYINSKNTVSIIYTVFCEIENVKEVCLQLVSHDIAIFSRSF